MKNTSFLQEMEYVAEEQRVAAAAGHAAMHTAACGIAAVCVVARCMLSGSKQRGAPRVQGENVTSAACGRISCVPT